MSKYDRLTDHLNEVAEDRRRLSFAEIEKILGFPLPASARAYPAWWGNHGYRGRHSLAWLSTGCKTEDVDLGGGQVTFARISSSRAEH